MSLCKASIIGNLGRDPEKRFSQQGQPLLRFSVAATTRKRDPRGEWQDHTEWFAVTVFGARAESLAERLAKGSRVYVEGRLESRRYEGREGPGFSLDLVASEVELLSPRAAGPADGGEAEAEAELAAAPAPAAADFDDLPF